MKVIQKEHKKMGDVTKTEIKTLLKPQKAIQSAPNFPALCNSWYGSTYKKGFNSRMNDKQSNGFYCSKA